MRTSYLITLSMRSQVSNLYLPESAVDEIDNALAIAYHA
jgi:hypothetical protein